MYFPLKIFRVGRHENIFIYLVIYFIFFYSFFILFYFYFLFLFFFFFVFEGIKNYTVSAKFQSRSG